MKMLRNILVVILGLLIGGFINMKIIVYGSSVVKYPSGVDPTNAESLKAGMHLLGFKHFMIPFIAHAIGTLIGAFIASKLGASKHFILAMIVGGFFLLGGISMVFILPAPVWFCLLDILVAYIPMAYLGWKLSGRGK
ncbi:MAG TPA: hypothetical protein VJL37_11475 [Flavobacterium sp.]|jgi:hypothetical protein|nr:hypothetical protein [Flavobacterium sp.]